MDDIKKKKQPNPEIEKLKQEAEDYKDKYLRALADYHNLEKRFENERQEVEKHVQVKMVMKLIPIIDNLEKAEIFIKDPGLKLINDHFTQFLQELGIKEVDVLGKEYDPHKAEAVDVVAGEKDNEVVEVLQKGYELNGRVIRAAQVKVSKKNPL